MMKSSSFDSYVVTMASYTLEFGLVDSVCFVITTVLVWR